MTDNLFYKPTKEEIVSEPRTKGKFLCETDARILIDRQLRQAGWDIEDKNQVSTEETSQTGRADYILKDGRGRALAVVEVKRFSDFILSFRRRIIPFPVGGVGFFTMILSLT